MGFIDAVFDIGRDIGRGAIAAGRTAIDLLNRPLGPGGESIAQLGAQIGIQQFATRDARKQQKQAARRASKARRQFNASGGSFFGQVLPAIAPGAGSGLPMVPRGLAPTPRFGGVPVGAGMRPGFDRGAFFAPTLPPVITPTRDLIAGGFPMAGALPGGAIPAGLGLGSLIPQAPIAGRFDLTDVIGGQTPLLEAFSGGVRFKRQVRAVNPSTGRETYFRNVGQPILFRGDLRTCKLVGKVGTRAVSATGRTTVPRKRGRRRR